MQVRYGSQRHYILLHREGRLYNHKHVHRAYCLEGSNLRSKRPKGNRAAAHRLARLPLGRLHQCWRMDFVVNNLLDGRKIRALTIIDNFSCQHLAIHVGQLLRGEDVVAVMTRLQ
jgi:putative transposase